KPAPLSITKKMCITMSNTIDIMFNKKSSLSLLRMRLDLLPNLKQVIEKMIIATKNIGSNTYQALKPGTNPW
ncbi:MAG: hypothetical protein IK092_03405, partial [Muribaculaceae bacterium]|nr:hypothetical protein [Muribaculaceae bacterium]